MHFTTLFVSSTLAGLAMAAPQGVKPSANSRRAGPEMTLPPVVDINTRSGDLDLIAKLITAPTQADRVGLLNLPGDYIFDFNGDSAPAASEAKGLGGFSVSANTKTMPALIGNGAAMTLGFLGPCGMNTAHVHNRATELNVVVKGRLVTNFVLENGARPIENTLSLYQMAVFPKGAIHQEFNPDCEDTVFVAGFDNADPGVSQIAQNFFSLRQDVVGATLGGIQTLNGQDIESFRHMIPKNIALGIDSCLSKCGLTRNAKRSVEELMG
ncbi:RmlC-like cupin domain-containing protein [Thelonectria olida]|uniref:RmlC-like cupin domain-containing protein n=1 Tax=Thelonectria olida TaxID=1576542 RepID=A0A9P8WD95_9HYPO|nr:RmlC-like cupin domain-containing protein [Thelonectria olida]